MSKPKVIKVEPICESCGCWIGVESHGTYCPLRTRMDTAKDD